ncbi:MAG TPA: hypothetical protein VFR93_04305 [Candidatus Limnocylindrales bacterium]|nr:hypothetical protein [Candidatus Limnocylindrales bacterium]
MPVRRTSPRRSATRPSTAFDRPSSDLIDDRDNDGGAGGVLAGAGPWLSVLALVLAAGTIGYLLINRGAAGGGSGDLTACRTAAWKAVPDEAQLPEGWTLGSTDLNANGITVSVMSSDVGGDGTSSPPVVYASVTCYGDGAAAALDANRSAAEAAGSTVTERGGGSDACEVATRSTGSTTTIFRVGSLVAQVADAGDATRAELDTITAAVARAMGNETAAGTSPNGPDEGPGGSDEPIGSGELPGDSSAPFAPELEGMLPKSIGDTTPGASPGATLALTIDSASATDVFGQDPSSRALAARIRALGKTLDDLQVAQAFDETGAVDIAILGFRLPGVDEAKLRSAILETWLSGNADGVKTTTPTLGGKSVTKIDYGDGRAFEYVYAKGDVVIDIETSDEAIATEVLAGMK